MCGLQEDEEYGEETDTGDEPVQDSQPLTTRRSTSHTHEVPDKEA